ncbi:MAG: aspartate aminotransferase family protein [Pirellulales bacterium]|nr:aspartate aminotransferase family protein [Pirellulales bacterium]
MRPRCQQLLDDLRKAFPPPVSDPVHDAYVVYSISRALDQVDALKSQSPILGSPVEPDWQHARAETIAAQGLPIELVIPQLVRYLEGMFVWGHPRTQVNVVPPPSIASIIGVLLPATFNPNLVSDEGSRRLSEAEVRVAAMAADLVGYDAATSAGVFTFGGTGALLYAVKIGLEKAQPGSMRAGVEHGAVLFASEQSHYSVLNVSSWLGIGADQVVRIPTNTDNALRLDLLEAALRESLAAGKSIAAIVATLGTTDAFGLDDLAGVVALRDRLVEEYALDYHPHIHADAVIGWAWSVFNDYDFDANELGFRDRTVRALAATHYRVQHLGLADSIGIDFHKTGYVPYVSSLVLVRDGNDFARIARPRESMPYLFQSGEHHPGMYTLETTRSGTGVMAALANLLLLGREGLRVLLGHAVEMAEVLRERIEAHPDLVVLNGENVGPVTLFRAYPHGTDTFTIKDRERSEAGFAAPLRAHNDYNRRIFERVNEAALAGHGVAISLTDCYRKTDYGEPIVALKSYVLSPFSDDDRMRSIITHVLDAKQAVDAAGG